MMKTFAGKKLEERSKKPTRKTTEPPRQIKRSENEWLSIKIAEALSGKHFNRYKLACVKKAADKLKQQGYPLATACKKITTKHLLNFADDKAF